MSRVSMWMMDDTLSWILQLSYLLLQLSAGSGTRGGTSGTGDCLNGSGTGTSGAIESDDERVSVAKQVASALDRMLTLRAMVNFENCR